MEFRLTNISKNYFEHCHIFSSFILVNLAFLNTIIVGIVFFSSTRKLIAVIAILLCTFANGPKAFSQFYTGSQMDFGKNRVKYESFFWTYYAYDRYDVYFYEEGKDLANYVSRVAKKNIPA